MHGPWIFAAYTLQTCHGLELSLHWLIVQLFWFRLLHKTLPAYSSRIFCYNIGLWLHMCIYTNKHTHTHTLAPYSPWWSSHFPGQSAPWRASHAVLEPAAWERSSQAQRHLRGHAETARLSPPARLHVCLDVHWCKLQLRHVHMSCKYLLGNAVCGLIPLLIFIVHRKKRNLWQKILVVLDATSIISLSNNIMHASNEDCFIYIYWLYIMHTCLAMASASSFALTISAFKVLSSALRALSLHIRVHKHMHMHGIVWTYSSIS